MRRIKSLFMLLAMMAGGFFAYGQTSPQDTYYRFDQAYVESNTVTPYVGDGAPISISTTNLKENNASYLHQDYSYVYNVYSSGSPLSLNIQATTENPAHIYCICNASREGYANPLAIFTTKLSFNSNIIFTTRHYGTLGLECIELITTKSGTHKISISSDAYKSGYAEIRVVYENNPTWQTLSNTRVVEFDASKVLADNPIECTLFRFQGRMHFDGENGTSLGDTKPTMACEGIFFTAPRDGVVEVEARHTNGPKPEHILTLDSINNGTFTQIASIPMPSSGMQTYSFEKKILKGITYQISDGSDTSVHIHKVRFIP